MLIEDEFLPRVRVVVIFLPGFHYLAAVRLSCAWQTIPALLI